MTGYTPTSPAAPQGQKSSYTIGMINQRLAELGLNASINEQVAQEIRHTEDPNRFIDALNKAVNNPNAKQWLVNLLCKHGIIDQNAAQGEPASETGKPNLTVVSKGNSGNHERSTPMSQYSDVPMPPSPQDNTRLDPSERLSFHVYGGKAAVCFNADLSRSGMPTVSLDGAMSKGTRQYNWADKIQIQLTRQELPEVLLVLMGFQKKCDFSNHGAQKDKGFSIEIQDKNLFINMRQKGKPLVAVPMQENEAFFVAGLLSRQIAKIFGGEQYLPMIPMLAQRLGALKARHANSRQN